MTVEFVTKTIFQLDEVATVVGTDYLAVGKTALGLTVKVKVENALAGIVGSVAGLPNANIFTRGQVIQPSNVADIGLLINMPTGATERPLRVRLNGTERFNINMSSTVTVFNLSGFDAGALSGPGFAIGRNTNASTAAPGYLSIAEADGDVGYLYPDNSLIWRTLNTAPTSANLGSGQAVGAQSSALSAKVVEGEFTDIEGALQLIRDTPLYRFAYGNRWKGEKFVGLITDDSPIFGLDRDEDHPNGKILNEVNAHGYVMAAIKALGAKVDDLDARLGAL